MFAPLPLLLAGFFTVSASAEETSKPDRFTQEILDIIDWNVSPCNDFYRHKCPRGLDIDKAPGRWALKKLKGIIEDKNATIFEKGSILDRSGFTSDSDERVLLGEIENRCKESIACYKDIFEIFRTAFKRTKKRDLQKELDVLLSGNHTELDAYRTIISNATMMNVFEDFLYRRLKERKIVRDVLLAEDTSNLNKLNDVVSDIKTEIRNSFVKTSYLKTQTVVTFLNTTQSWYEIYKKHLFIVPYLFLGVTDVILPQVMEKFEKAYHYAEAKIPGKSSYTFDLFHAYAHSKLREDYVKEYIDNLEFDFLAPEFQGVNYVDYIRFNGVYSVAFIDVHPAVLYGGFGTVLAHEIFHTFTDARFNERESAVGVEPIVDFQKSKASATAETCVFNAYTKFANESEEARKAGPYLKKQVAEDAPDIEGLRAAYIAFAKKFDVKAPAFPNLNITNGQLFFYAYWAVNCNSNGQNVGFHSANVFRVNAALRQLQEFQDTFNCRAGDFMAIPEEKRCYFFGPRAPEDS